MHPACLGVLILAAAAGPSSPAQTMKDRTGDSDALPVRIAPSATPCSISMASPLAGVTSHIPGVPRPAIRPTDISLKDIRHRLLETFQSYVGVKEVPLGSNNGPMVDKFNWSCCLAPGEHAPWCASVTHYGYQINGLKGRGAYSPDWFSKERKVSQNNVSVGDTALVFFLSKRRYAHTIACVERVVWSAGRVVEVQTLEGNTNAQGSREGDQFARRIRPADTLTFVRWWNQ